MSSRYDAEARHRTMPPMEQSRDVAALPDLLTPALFMKFLKFERGYKEKWEERSSPKNTTPDAMWDRLRQVGHWEELYPLGNASKQRRLVLVRETPLEPVQRKVKWLNRFEFVYAPPLHATEHITFYTEEGEKGMDKRIEAIPGTQVLVDPLAAPKGIHDAKDLDSAIVDPGLFAHRLNGMRLLYPYVDLERMLLDELERD